MKLLRFSEFDDIYENLNFFLCIFPKLSLKAQNDKILKNIYLKKNGRIFLK